MSMDINKKVDMIINEIENGNRKELTMYDELAEVYDFLYGREYDYEKQSSYIQDALNNTNDKKIIEGGCGTGRLLKQLSLDIPDAKIKGVELHKGMSELSKSRTSDLDNVDVKQGDMFDVSGEYSVFSLFGVMAHVSESMREDLFSRVYDTLYPNGAFVLNYKHPEFEVNGRYSPWSGETDKYEIKSHFITLYDNDDTYYAVSYEFKDKEKGKEYCAGELMDIYFHNPDDIIADLEKTGFKSISTHGDKNKNGVIIAYK